MEKSGISIFRFWRRLTALFLLICFTLLNSSYPSFAAGTNPTAVTPSFSTGHFPVNLSRILIPQEMGNIQQSFKGKSGKVVVLIQDAHGIPDAQRNIQKLIGHFQKQYGVNLVALEGAASQLDPQIFKSFPDKEVLKKTFDQYFEQGELTGGTAAAILNESESDYQGIEDWNAYEEALRLYLQAMEKEPKILKKLKTLKQTLKEEKKKVYSKELLELDQIFEDFYKNNGSLLKVLQPLGAIQKPAAESELALLFAESQKQERGDELTVLEVKEIAQKVGSYLRSKSVSKEGKEKLKAFNTQYQEFQTSRIAPQAFALFLEGLAAKYQLPIKISDTLSHAMKNQQRLAEIKGTKLFEDFERYAQSVEASLIQNEVQRRLAARTHELRLLERLARFELSREDWNEIKSQIASYLLSLLDFCKMDGALRGQAVEYCLSPKGSTPPGFHFAKIQSLIKFIGSKYSTDFRFNKSMKVSTSAFGLLAMTMLTSLRANEVSEAISQLFKYHIAFYQNAEKREAAFLKNLGKLLNRKTSSPALFVAGGFHTEGLTQKLKEQGISYLLLTPRMNSIPEETHYRDHMQGDLSWKKYFEVENGKIDLHKAFVRGVRDRLLGQAGGTALIKSWRDQIIIDLAGKNALAHAGQYTAFLDELAGNSAQAKEISKVDLSAKWMSKIEKFIEGLQSLESGHQLSQQNILNLLQPSTLASLEAAGLAEKSRLNTARFRLQNGLLTAVRTRIPAGMPIDSDSQAARAEVRDTGTPPAGGQEQPLEADPLLGLKADEIYLEKSMGLVKLLRIIPDEDKIVVSRLNMPASTGDIYRQGGGLANRVPVSALLSNALHLLNARDMIRKGYFARYYRPELLVQEKPKFKLTPEAEVLAEKRAKAYMGAADVFVPFPFGLDVVSRRIMAEHERGEENQGYYTQTYRRVAREFLGGDFLYPWDYLKNTFFDKSKDLFLKTLFRKIFEETGEDVILTGVLESFGRQEASSISEKNRTDVWTFSSSTVQHPYATAHKTMFGRAYDTYASSRRWPDLKGIQEDVDFYYRSRLLMGLRSLNTPQENFISESDYESIWKKFHPALAPYYPQRNPQFKNDKFSQLMLELTHRIRVQNDFSKVGQIYDLVQPQVMALKPVLNEIDLVLPAPSIYLMGNQTIPLADLIARELNRQISITALTQVRPRKKQRNQPDLWRRAKNAACFFEGQREELKGKKVLIVDDNETTGFTAAAMAAAAYEAGAAKVLVLSYGRTVYQKEALDLDEERHGEEILSPAPVQYSPADYLNIFLRMRIDFRGLLGLLREILRHEETTGYRFSYVLFLSALADGIEAQFDAPILKGKGLDALAYVVSRAIREIREEKKQLPSSEELRWLGIIKKLLKDPVYNFEDQKLLEAKANFLTALGNLRPIQEDTLDYLIQESDLEERATRHGETVKAAAEALGTMGAAALKALPSLQTVIVKGPGRMKKLGIGVKTAVAAVESVRRIVAEAGKQGIPLDDSVRQGLIQAIEKFSRKKSYLLAEVDKGQIDETLALLRSEVRWVYNMDEVLKDFKQFGPALDPASLDAKSLEKLPAGFAPQVLAIIFSDLSGEDRKSVYQKLFALGKKDNTVAIEALGLIFKYYQPYGVPGGENAESKAEKEALIEFLISKAEKNDAAALRSLGHLVRTQLIDHGVRKLGYSTPPTHILDEYEENKIVNFLKTKAESGYTDADWSLASALSGIVWYGFFPYDLGPLILFLKNTADKKKMPGIYIYLYPFLESSEQSEILDQTLIPAAQFPQIDSMTIRGLGQLYASISHKDKNKAQEIYGLLLAMLDKNYGANAYVALAEAYPNLTKEQQKIVYSKIKAQFSGDYARSALALIYKQANRQKYLMESANHLVYRYHGEGDLLIPEDADIPQDFAHKIQQPPPPVSSGSDSLNPVEESDDDSSNADHSSMSIEEEFSIWEPLEVEEPGAVVPVLPIPDKTPQIQPSEKPVIDSLAPHDYEKAGFEVDREKGKVYWTEYKVIPPADNPAKNPEAQKLMNDFESFEEINSEVLRALGQKNKDIQNLMNLLHLLAKMVKTYLVLFKKQTFEGNEEDPAAVLAFIQKTASAPSDLQGGRSIAHFYLKIRQEIEASLNTHQPGFKMTTPLSPEVESIIQPFDGKKTSKLAATPAENYSSGLTISFAELINIVHQKGHRNLGDALPGGSKRKAEVSIEPKSKAMAGETASITLNYLDARENPAQNHPLVVRHIALAFAKGQLVHHNSHLYNPSNALVLANENRALVGLSLGVHSARIQVALMPAQEKGRVMVNYTDSDGAFAPGSKIRNASLAIAFYHAGFKVPGVVEDKKGNVRYEGDENHFDAFFDKDNGASSIDEFPDKIDFAIQALTSTKDLDLAINQSSLKTDPQAIENLARRFSEDGYLIRKASLKESMEPPLPKEVSELKKEAGKAGIEMEKMPDGQRMLDKLSHERNLALARGAVKITENGKIHLIASYQDAAMTSPVETFLKILSHADEKKKEELKQTAAVVRGITELISRRVIGSAGNYLIEELTLPALGDKITFYALRDPAGQAGNYDGALAVLGEFPYNTARYDSFRQKKLENNFLSPGDLKEILGFQQMWRPASVVPELSVEKLTAKVSQGVAQRISPVALGGVSLNEGKALGFVRLNHPGKLPADFKNGILTAESTDTPDDEKIKNSSGILVTTGGLLSHAAIRVREYGKPGGVFNAAKITEQGLVFNVFGSGEHHGKIKIAGKDVSYAELSDYRERKQVIHDGDLVYLDGYEGVVYLIAEAGDSGGKTVQVFKRYQDWKEKVGYAGKKIAWAKEKSKALFTLKEIDELGSIMDDIHNLSLLKAVTDEIASDGLIPLHIVKERAKGLPHGAGYTHLQDFFEDEAKSAKQAFEKKLEEFKSYMTSNPSPRDIEQVYLMVDALDRLARELEGKASLKEGEISKEYLDQGRGQMLGLAKKWLEQFQISMAKRLGDFVEDLRKEPGINLLKILRFTRLLGFAGFTAEFVQQSYAGLSSTYQELEQKKQAAEEARKKEVEGLKGRGILWKEALKDRFARLLAGGKGSNSGEIIQALETLRRAGVIDSKIQVRVPQGFVIQPTEYFLWVEQGKKSGLDPVLKNQLALAYRDLAAGQMKRLNAWIERDQDTDPALKKVLIEKVLNRVALLEKTETPEAIEGLVLAYRDLIELLIEQFKDKPISPVLTNRLQVFGAVAVRSSGLTEDTFQESKAGMKITRLNRWGLERLYEAVREVWSDGSEAILVEEMINPLASGVAFSADVKEKRTDRISMDAAWGLAKGLVDQSVKNPDRYLVSKKNGNGEYAVLHSEIGRKEEKIILNLGLEGSYKEVPTSSGEQHSPALSTDQVRAVAQVIDQLSQYLGYQVDVEFSIDPDSIWILQARPITTLQEAIKNAQDLVMRSENRQGSRMPTVAKSPDSARSENRQGSRKLAVAESLDSARSELRSVEKPLGFGEGQYQSFKIGGSDWRQVPKGFESEIPGQYLAGASVKVRNIQTQTIPMDVLNRFALDELSFRIRKSPEGLMMQYFDQQWGNLPMIPLKPGVPIIIKRGLTPVKPYPKTDTDLESSLLSSESGEFSILPKKEQEWRTIIFWTEMKGEKKQVKSVYLPRRVLWNAISRGIERDDPRPGFDMNTNTFIPGYLQTGHVEIELMGNKVKFADLGSTYGTTLEVEKNWAKEEGEDLSVPLITHVETGIVPDKSLTNLVSLEDVKQHDIPTNDALVFPYHKKFSVAVLILGKEEARSDFKVEGGQLYVKTPPQKKWEAMPGNSYWTKHEVYAAGQTVLVAHEDEAVKAKAKKVPHAYRVDFDTTTGEIKVYNFAASMIRVSIVPRSEVRKKNIKAFGRSEIRKAAGLVAEQILERRHLPEPALKGLAKSVEQGVITMGVAEFGAMIRSEARVQIEQVMEAGQEQGVNSSVLAQQETRAMQTISWLTEVFQNLNGSVAVAIHAPGEENTFKAAISHIQNRGHIFALLTSGTNLEAVGNIDKMPIGELSRLRARSFWKKGIDITNKTFLPTMQMTNQPKDIQGNRDLLSIESINRDPNVFGAFEPIVNAVSRLAVSTVTGSSIERIGDLSRPEVRKNLVAALLKGHPELLTEMSNLEKMFQFNGKTLIVDQHIIALVTDYLARSEVRKAA